MRDFSDQNARSPIIAGVRDRVTATVDPSIKEDQVRATITLKDGRRFETFIEHVVGSLERPMTDTDLEAKFMELVDGVLAPPRGRALMDLCWKIDTLPSAAELARAAAVT